MMQSIDVLALDAFVPPLAPVVLLAFLGTAFIVFCATLAAAIATAGRRVGLARVLGGAGLGVSVVYGTLLLGASLLSSPRTLRPGEKKYFCEMDCHLAYSVLSAAAPSGRQRAVTVQTWFDPSTIASFRGNGPLTPNPRVVYLVDESGRRYPPSDPASVLSLARLLRPDESYTTRFVFEVPPDARALRFFLGDPPGMETLILNHENSPFHARIDFELPPIAASRDSGS